MMQLVVPLAHFHFDYLERSLGLALDLRLALLQRLKEHHQI